MPKREPKKRASKPTADKQPETPAPKPVATATVTLWGEVKDATDRDVLFAVLNHGAAKDIGLNGEVWIAKRQIYGGIRRQDGYQYLRIGYAYASLLAKSCQQCE